MKQRLLIGLVGMTVLGFQAAMLAETERPPAGTNMAPVVAAQEANLPVILLDIPGAITRDQRAPCSVTIICPAGSDCGTTNRLPASIRYHGSSSLGYAKKSFALALDQPESLVGMGKAAHWVLNAAYIDRSLMRHKLAYDLFRSLATAESKRYAAASQFVEVRVNGKYHGACLLMERVDRRRLDFQPFQSNAVSHACLYKAVDHAANFGQRNHAGFEQREPDPLVKAYWQPLDELMRFVSSASDAEFFHPQTGIQSRLDLENAMDFHLLVLLTSNSDGITKNYMLARDAQGGPAANTRFFFVPWDYDGTFGRNWDASRVPPSLWLSNHLFDRLLGHKPYQEKFAARWSQLREHQFSIRSVHAMIDANVRTLGNAARRNAERWPTNRGGYPDRIGFEEDIAQMKSWVEARIQWLDGEIQRRCGKARP